MPDTLSSLDWSLIPAFLAVAETGSLSGAASRLGRSQPTLGRQIRQIEDALQATLFTRHPRGLHLTAAGENLLPHAQQMFAAAQSMALGAQGQSKALHGTVRISASTVIANHILPPILAQIRENEPGLRIELTATDSVDNLLLREADIALRMFQTTQLDVVTRHIGDFPISICAARSYLAIKGVPQSVEDLSAHDLVGFDRSDLILRGMHAMGLEATRDWFAVRCDDQPAYIQLVRAGCGIGFVQRHLINSLPELEEIHLGVNIPALPLWLAAPTATRHSPRISKVWKLLLEGLSPLLS